MRILAIDPGTIQSGYVLYAPGLTVIGDTIPNEQMFGMIDSMTPNVIAVEMIASYGMPVGREVFETCVWIGRYVQYCLEHGKPFPRFVYRKDVKMALCQSPRAKDANVWQALVDRFGEPGSKKLPGFLYGIRSHARAALAVAVYMEMRLRAQQEGRTC